MYYYYHMGIIVYNITKETHEGNNCFKCFRGASVLGNPYTHIKDRKTLAMFVVKDREEAIAKYSDYFDQMYGKNRAFTGEIDKIYEKYKNGEDVYLGCYCHPLSCHCDIIKDKLQRRLIKEKIKNLKNEEVKTKEILA